MSDRRQSIYRQNRLPRHLRTISRDRRVSGNAIGLYAHLCASPEILAISPRALVKLKRFGGPAIVNKALNELLEAGLIVFESGGYRLTSPQHNARRGDA